MKATFAPKECKRKDTLEGRKASVAKQRHRVGGDTAGYSPAPVSGSFRKMEKPEDNSRRFCFYTLFSPQIITTALSAIYVASFTPACTGSTVICLRQEGSSCKSRQSGSELSRGSGRVGVLHRPVVGAATQHQWRLLFPTPSPFAFALCSTLHATFSSLSVSGSLARSSKFLCSAVNARYACIQAAFSARVRSTGSSGLALLGVRVCVEW